MNDSGARLFLKGEYYYRHLGELSVNVCVAKTIADADWQKYLEGTCVLSKAIGRAPKAAIVTFVGAHPNAGQRRLTTEFLARENLPPIGRVALLTDNELLRGAMIAFSWVMPKSRLRAFKGNDHANALQWLREMAEFDVPAVMAVWNEARAELGAARPSIRIARG